MKEGLIFYLLVEQKVVVEIRRQFCQRIVVADHRKIGNAATSLIWRSHDIDIFITDKKASIKAITPFTDKGIEVIRA